MPGCGRPWRESAGGTRAIALQSEQWPLLQGRGTTGSDLLVERLGREIGERLRTSQPEVWRCLGREVKLIDGTTASMPDTSANQAEFPQSRTQKPGLGFPLIRLVAIISLSCGAVRAWATGPCKGKHSGETALLRQLAHGLSPGDIVIADRYFSGYFLLAWLIRQGVDVVVQQHQLRHTDFRLGKRLGAKDHVVAWARPPRPAWMDAATYAAMPETQILREVRVAGLTLVTTLVDAGHVSKKELLTLYHARWQVELDLRSIKTVMQMDVLRCKSPAMVKKEIAVHLLAYKCYSGQTPVDTRVFTLSSIDSVLDTMVWLEEILARGHCGR